jgi:hypothetical protein
MQAACSSASENAVRQLDMTASRIDSPLACEDPRRSPVHAFTVVIPPRAFEEFYAQFGGVRKTFVLRPTENLRFIESQEGKSRPGIGYRNSQFVQNRGLALQKRADWLRVGGNKHIAQIGYPWRPFKHETHAHSY